MNVSDREREMEGTSTDGERVRRRDYVTSLETKKMSMISCDCVAAHAILYKGEVKKQKQKPMLMVY